MELNDIIEQADIVSYISQFCDLEEKQDGEYWGLSPLKEEHTPSFSVNAELQRFYDFSSGQGGNILDFIKAYYGCDLRKGISILKEFANVKDGDEILPSKRLQATSIAKKFRTRPKQVKQSKSEILKPNYMERYERRPDKLEAWREEGITPESMERFLVRYDTFSDRIVFPLRNPSGDIINVCGRTLDPLYKEHKQRKYTYFKPLGVLNTIYGLAENKEAILQRKEIILFEGAKSVLIADGWGLKNTGAILTSHLNSYQFKLLIQLGVTVVFALDAEVDIRQDANIQKLLPYVKVEWVKNRGNLLDDKDSPVDKGKEVFKELYHHRVRLR